MEIPKQKVILGENLRRMVVYLVIMQGQSYAETQRSLQHQYNTKISQGEISNILEGESIVLTPYYNYLFELLAAEKAAHYDETSWETQHQGTEISEGNYCWLKISVANQNRIFWFGRSRGKGVAEALRGEQQDSIGVSDDYGSYRNLFEHQQLCWAHPHRKLRDLAEGTTLTGDTKKSCQKVFKNFASIYKKAKKVREKLRTPTWTKAADTLFVLYSVIYSLIESHPDQNFFTLYDEVANFFEGQ